MATMRISQIVGAGMFVPPEWDRECHHIVLDSRDVKRGDLFIARAGSLARGQDFIKAALAAGAIAVLEEGEFGFRCEAGGVPVFSVPDLASQLPGWLLRRYQQARTLPLLAVTGTNGKSSTVQYVAQLVSRLGQRCGVIGTTGNGIWPDLQPTRNTTPDLATTLRCLEEMQEQGACLAAMEVSSHGLHQGRVSGLEFAVAAITNITQDHLDYHGTMDNYQAAKQRLFTDFPLGQAILNLDDARIAAMRHQANLRVPGLTLSCEQDADIMIRDPQFSSRWMSAQLTSPWGEARLQVPLIGGFNLVNAVMAISMLAAAGFDFNALVAAAASLRPVDGRMELYVRDGSPSVVVDFAHTPDAISTVIGALRPWNRPLTLVYGCGGERDRSKRPLMTEAALAADQVWLTDDNPRGESPAQIWVDALDVDGAGRVVCEHNRERAIVGALAATPADGLLVIAGKGHENYQEIAGVRHPYRDADVLLEMGYQRAGGEDVV
ncbi:UDP-N-acetylmuramoyl-L-alanyl-D-glutamate--2,6-diaminopimelate ligase [Parathalassolituus penaei]|uniref:UDP-N-acetylmuramoyl-L-alanyl-D-glutamate--2,6-diaminopimelate ligase n=1 Tax=Parathalassolituus penaei TaxID=2997323 RepID=A0A9X3EFY5_9GAMM|nr:UDP-N-acetylmuramoyl-L-alanyl-D-glutamate--2,6-diaminopimelate ligase [Parathalassolituus penaei]MCY0966019.1 UDP-N-acetylmuramoyl-L-alanyl-D-glutamate--2,6-diaminopimelate ligase [Parathalassolituus penaei]